MLIPLRISKRGFRVVFESLARANDISANPSGEFLRKVRTLAGNFQLFSRETWLFNPLKNRLWLQTISHKLLRLACPIFLFGTLVTSAFLARRGFYKFALVVQLLVYALALVGRYRARREENAHENVCPIKKPALPFRIASAAYMFCLLHWATVVGFLRFSRGQANATWKRVPAVRPSRVTSAREPLPTKERALP
jgi:biofilm PGA synthesis N-glycosyltransferase PgaC